jgi:FPC/CPF motif-containing protein YcgG
VNPFSDALALENSSYSAFTEGRLVQPHTGERAPALHAFVHGSLRALVLNDQFTCLGGKSALRHGAYRFGFYPALGTPAAAAGLARDLFTFVSELPSFGESFSTYLASFDGPPLLDEAAFEDRLWTTLQALHDRDAAHHAWDPSVSTDPADPDFSYSFGGVAFFVIGLHAASSRVTRRFAWPTLVFNPHRQFEALRAHGGYGRFQQVIRHGEQNLQGGINPMLADHGSRSEAVQYSGRQVEGPWRCPFHARASDDAAAD